MRVSEMLESLLEVGGPEALALVKDAPDARVQKLVVTWPTKFAPERALALGYRADQNFTEIVRAFARLLPTQ